MITTGGAVVVATCLILGFKATAANGLMGEMKLIIFFLQSQKIDDIWHRGFELIAIYKKIRFEARC